MELREFKEVLLAAGFRQNPRSESWFKRSARKLFSYETIRDHDRTWLGSRLRDDVPDNEFWFYFNFPPSSLEGVRETLASMQLDELTPVVKASFQS